MSEKKKQDQVYVATRTAHVAFGPGRTVIKKNVTRVAAGHPLLEAYPTFFQPADQGVRFGVEDTTDRPTASTRTVPSAPPADPEPTKPEDYTGSDWKKADLEAEIDRRNDARAAGDVMIEVAGKGNVEDLRAALVADDERQAQAAADLGLGTQDVPGADGS
jgi:hypothetical protein